MAQLQVTDENLAAPVASQRRGDSTAADVALEFFNLMYQKKHYSVITKSLNSVPKLGSKPLARTVADGDEEIIARSRIVSGFVLGYPSYLARA